MAIVAAPFTAGGSLALAGMTAVHAANATNRMINDAAAAERFDAAIDKAVELFQTD
jgi:hypothetical protein